MRQAAALSFSSLFPFSSLWLPLWSTGRTKSNRGAREKEEKRCNSTRLLYLAAWPGPDAPQRTLTAQMTAVRGIDRQFCFSTRCHREVAEASTCGSAALRRMKQGAYSWHESKLVWSQTDKTAQVTSLQAQLSDAPRALHADIWIICGPSFQGSDWLSLIARAWQLQLQSWVQGGLENNSMRTWCDVQKNHSRITRGKDIQ